MTMEETAAEPAKLSFGATFGGAFSAVFGQFWMFIKAALLPFVLGILFAVAGTALAAVTPTLTFLWQIFAMVPLAILGVACCRLVLIGRQAGAIPRPLFGRRTWVYFGYALLMVVLMVVPVIAIVAYFAGDIFLSFDTGVQDPEAAAQRLSQTFGITFLAYLVIMYLLTRLSLVFPAVSVDEKLGLGGSWRLTRGANGFKLYAVFIVLSIVCIIAVMIVMFIVSAVFSFFLFLPGTVPTGPGEFDVLAVLLSSAPTLIVAFALEYLVLAIFLAALAKAYAQVSGWGGPQGDIVERFE